MIEKYSHKFRCNLKSGITVGLVSIPLSISLAIASGVSPVIGIIAAFWGGAVAAFFAGSTFNVIGPTGALSGLILSYALTQDVATLPILTIIVGLLVLLAWALNFHKYLIYIPGAVIHGFTLGVACIIALGQINNAFGLKPTQVHEQMLLNIYESTKVLPHTNVISGGIFILGLIFLLIAKKRIPQLPGAILLTGFGIILGFVTATGLIPVNIPTLYSKFGQLSLQLIPNHLPKLSVSAPMLQAASVIAFIAIIETMLSAKVANIMTKTRFKERQEILALALSNITSGLMGGIPVTAALARTSLNIKSGADSKASSVISALVIGIVSVLFFNFFSYLPLAIVAAILVNVAINMVEKDHFLFLFRHDRLSFYMALSVAIITVAADPIIAVSVGSVVLLLRQIQQLSHGDYEILVNQNKKLTNRITGDNLHKLEEGGDPLVYSFNANLTYLNKEAHISRLEHIAKNAKNIILRFRSVSYIDPDGILMLEEIIETFERQNVNVYLTGVSEKILRKFDETQFLCGLSKSGRMFEKTSDALAKIYMSK
jgi:sulfate permease, SulP family